MSTFKRTKNITKGKCIFYICITILNFFENIKHNIELDKKESPLSQANSMRMVVTSKGFKSMGIRSTSSSVRMSNSASASSLSSSNS